MLEFILVVGVALFAVGVRVFATGTVWWALWNWLAPSLLGYPEISYWHAVGLALAVQVVIGSVRGLVRRCG